MKWSVVVLLALGVVAALCAALLVISMQNKGGGGGAVSPRPSGPGEVSYVVAARDLDPRTILGEDAVESRSTTADQMPSDGLSQPAGVIGQVLQIAMKKGQPFTRGCFASGGGLILAGTLRDGQRAVSIPLTDSGGIEHLLYPGCVVDVLASMTVKDDSGSGDQPVAVTILQGVHVLAVGDQAVGSPQPVAEGGVPRPSNRSTVTVLVDAKQAEVLYLARQRGSVSIALRNPSDKPGGMTEGTRLAHLGPVFASAEKAALERLREKAKEEAEALKREREKAQFEMERARNSIEIDRKEFEIQRIVYESKRAEAERSTEKTIKPEWETVILRGGAVETKKFQIPEKKP